jgi:CBS domain-containing membrane protein
MLDLALGTFVTYNPRSISAITTVGEALELMDQLGIHHLPVVEHGSQIVGIVSHRDLATRRPSSVGDVSNFDDLPVERVMVRIVFTIDHTASPKAALQAILDHGFHSVPVLEDGTLVGMITSTDFLRELTYGEWPICRDNVGDHMLSLSSDEVLFSAATETDALVEESSVVSPDQTLGTAVGLMLEFGVREIAVVDDVGQPVGILRDDDILRAIVNFLA